MVSENFIGTSNLIPEGTFPCFLHKIWCAKTSCCIYMCVYNIYVYIHNQYHSMLSKKTCLSQSSSLCIRFTIPQSHRLRSGLCSVAHSWNDHLGGAIKIEKFYTCFLRLSVSSPENSHDMKWYKKNLKDTNLNPRVQRIAPCCPNSWL